MKNHTAIYTLALFIFLSACSTCRESRSQHIAPETVMTEGMTITVTNKTGVMKVSAGKGYERSYTWEGETRTLTLVPRKERWAGRFGIGASKSFRNHNTISRANLEEEQWGFESLESAMSVLNHRTRMDGNTVYNDEGLMVTWKKAIHPDPYRKSGNVLLVYVYQILIDGKKPNKLPNSQNDKIITTHN